MINSPLISGKVRFAAAYTIIDGYLFERQIKMLKSVSNQIKIADVVLINKSDKISREESLSISSQIKEINPFCNIFNTEFAKLPDSEIESINNNQGNALIINTLNPNKCIPLTSPPEIRVETLSTTKRINKEDLELLANQLKSVLRAKGFVRSSDGSNWTVQAVAGEITFREYSSQLLRSEIVFFGEVNTKNVNNLFKI